MNALRLIFTRVRLFSCLSEKRESLLQHGKLDVVKALNDLPKTKHVASSFVVDVTRATVSVSQNKDTLRGSLHIFRLYPSVQRVYIYTLGGKIKMLIKEK